MAKTVAIPEELLRELIFELSRVEEVLATIEELLDEEGLKRIRRAVEEYRQGDYIVVYSSEVKKVTRVSDCFALESGFYEKLSQRA
ncbi:hypothetical protein TCARB_1101 [Thermofilum adornatum 1505]|uniref:Uncharacterized protein n=1 Tax=Thermofilum adornatum 1505 TaxID=697581 RepID=A0A3G1A5M5_9CREN|nr:hypothetical protein [Thermofilum adornatum]AJB42149.1 hypothetical protein TCARB_1101 [Thermofilum adornatum 1505]